MGNSTPSYRGSNVSLGFKALIINITWLFKEFENRGTNIIKIGHDFYDIWWLLKEPF